MTRQKQPFRFKKFSVDDSNCAMKVGTDAVLLGAWANVNNAKRILDIGTGSGVIALMMAQRTDLSTKIDAVEMEEVDIIQAFENFKNCPWATKITAYHLPIQHFSPSEGYDLIVSNPPYFTNNFLPPTNRRKIARNTASLPYQDLLKVVRDLLNPEGRFCLILPTAEGDQFQTLASTFGLLVVRKTSFYTRFNKPQERWLFEFSFTPSELTTNHIVLYQSQSDDWSEDYHNLTKEFYLDKKK